MTRRPGSNLGSVATRAALAAVIGLVPACAGSSDSSESVVAEINVAAASDLRPAFEEAGEIFEESTGTRVAFSFGSSGQLREQIINGAPFDLFASANAEFVDEVIAAGHGVASTRADYALGRIVLRAASDVEPPASIDELTDQRFERITIANPDHAPYGAAAQQALQTAGVYETVEPRLVLGNNVSDTLRIVESGNADAGIVALSLAISDGEEYTLVPDDLHEPLEQALVVTSTGPRGDAATDFAEFLASPPGREVMTRYGFTLPDEQLRETSAT